MDELDQSLGDGGLRGKKFALDAADVCAHTACGDDEAVADGDPRQLSVVKRQELRSYRPSSRSLARSLAHSSAHYDH